MIAPKWPEARGGKLDLHGKPEAIPFRPQEFVSRQADFGLLDYSALPFGSATLADLDSLEHATQLAAAEFAQVRCVGDAAAVSSLDGGLAIDTLVTTPAVPIYSILVQIPLQLLDRGLENAPPNPQVGAGSCARWSTRDSIARDVASETPGTRKPA
jgi:hypothetical protein